MNSFAFYIGTALIAILPAFTGNFHKNISVKQADKIIRENDGGGSLVILDVRTPGEFSKEHLAGAINVDFWGKNFADSVSKLDRGKIYLVYCTSGVRSRGAMKQMRTVGFTRIYNMRGGMFAWKAARMPVEKRVGAG